MKGAHPLLAQLPLTVSPFIDLPKAATLPYTYRTIQTSLGPSSVGEAGDSQKQKYVIAQSGHAAHPNEIIAACQELQKHIQRLKETSEEDLKAWQDSIKQRELAEKRKIAPGWLDNDAKILQPTRKEDAPAHESSSQNIMDSQEAGPGGKGLVEQREDEGTALDRAFGGMGLK